MLDYILKALGDKVKTMQQSSFQNETYFVKRHGWMINVQPVFNSFIGIYVHYVHLRMKCSMFSWPFHNNNLCCLNDYENNKTELNNVLVQPKNDLKLTKCFLSFIDNHFHSVNYLRKPWFVISKSVKTDSVPFITAFSWSSTDLHFCFRVSRSPNRLSRMAFAIGSIMAVVAVLLSHMDRKDEVSIIPSMSLEKQFCPQS